MGKKGNGEGSISRRADGRWQGCISVGRDDSGKIKRSYCYGKTRKEVAEKINEALKEVRENTYIDRKQNPTLEEWLQGWLWQYKRPSVKATTFAQYETIVRVHIIPALGAIKLVDLRTDNIQLLLNRMHKNGLSRRTIELAKVVLHAAVKQAKKNKMVSENVCENVVLPRNENTKEVRILNTEEQSKLIASLENNYIGRGMLLALYTGLRRGEILALTWDDFDVDEKTLTVNKALSRIKTYREGPKTELVVSSPKTRTSNRVIPLIEKAVKLLEFHKKEQKKYMEMVGSFYADENIIFSSSCGGYMDPGNFNRKLKKVAKELNIEGLSPHVLRHCFATRGLEAEISLKAMQEFLGHSSIKVTGDIYTHVLKEQKRKEISKLNEIF